VDRFWTGADCIGWISVGMGISAGAGASEMIAVGDVGVEVIVA
jgi:hypothetical protein